MDLVPLRGPGRASRPARRRVAIFLVGIALLAGCSSTNSESSEQELLSLQDLADVAFAGKAGLTRVDVAESGTDGSVSMSVVMAPDVAAAQLVDAATLARSFSEQHSTKYRWVTHLYAGEPPAPLQIEIYPKVWTSAEADTRAALSIAKLPGVQSISIAAGTSYVTATAVTDLPELVESLRKAPIWSSGGSLQAENGRVRLMDSPARVTVAQLNAIATVAVAHPTADFALEAAATGERYPELYINRVTTQEAAAITATFTDASLVSQNAEGYQLDFTMRAFGTDGNPVDSVGTFGRP